ncbi:hypothetical protein PUN28_008637 [Cardiocondyla obscurior]|uniref:Uncharacterized protein n=1 Tax=Cardiocondyla obscurior TaxID=286306 RepID=A0AAW2G0I0_9HYME
MVVGLPRCADADHPRGTVKDRRYRNPRAASAHKLHDRANISRCKRKFRCAKRLEKKKKKKSLTYTRTAIILQK